MTRKYSKIIDDAVMQLKTLVITMDLVLNEVFMKL